MKKLILAIVVAVSCQVAIAQISPIEQNRQAIAFLKERCLDFNKGLVPVKTDELQKFADSLSKAEINYSRTVYVFYGESINDQTCGGGSSEAVTGKNPVPFIKYRIYTEGGLTYIEVIDGNPYI